MFSGRSGLYAIVDGDALGGRDPLAFAEALLSAAPLFALQLRAKRWSARETLAVARALAERCARRGVPFVVNDRADVAAMSGASAVHVGQGDLSIAQARRVAPQAAVGRSTHDLAQVDLALAEGPDYLAYGPVFATRSKENPDPTVGLAGLASAAARSRAAGVALVAIGGITLENARDVRRAGADAIAVIGALSALADDPTSLHATARALHEALTR
jgi:thiamine-phosphate pyrophosphorylase